MIEDDDDKPFAALFVEEVLTTYFSKGRGKGLEDALKGGFGGLHDFQFALGGHSEHTADTDIAIESITLDFLRGTLKDGDTELRKRRVFDFFKSHPDVHKPSLSFRKKFTLDQKRAAPAVPLHRDVFATFSPFHLAIMFLADMQQLDDDKRMLIDILKQRMIEDKEFARDALFTEVDNEDLFDKVSYLITFKVVCLLVVLAFGYVKENILICSTKYFDPSYKNCSLPNDL